MKHNVKRILSALLLLIFVAQAIVLPVSAEKESTESTFPQIVVDDNASYTVGGPSVDKYLNGFSTDGRVAYGADDKVNAIVMLKGESILSLSKKAGMTAAEYVRSDAGIKAVADMKAEQNRVIKELGAEISNVKFRYTTIFSGFSCTTTYKMLSQIESTYAGSSALIAERYEAEVEATDNALNAYETGIYNSSEVGYTGQGMVVAILDTGLDYNHTAFQKLPDGEVRMTDDDIAEIYPSLTAAGLNESSRWEECYYSDKVIFMYDYADLDSDVYPINDHGTHVAGIIAGKDEKITGVAVDAQLAIMKVFGNEDAGAEQESLIAALEDSVLLGVDVINMSLGSSCGFSRAADEEGINEIYDAVREAGINLIVAASNSYSSAKGSNVGDTNRTTNPDSSTLGSPATYDSSLAVASVLGAKSHYLLANGVEPIYLIKANNNLGDEIEFYDDMLGGKDTAEYEYVLVPGLGNDDNYANVDVNGKIAIIKRGVTTFEEKVQIAEVHGAVGAIIYNNVSGTITMTIGVATLPTCSISMDSGVYFEKNPTGKLVFSSGNLAGPFMSEFSSWGPNSDLILTPDLTSYGGDITSAVRDGYDIYSGTSMACPNLAGSAALVRQYAKKNYPTLTDDEITTLVNRLLMSTSSILLNEAGNPYSPRKQGSGLADAARAVSTGAYLLVEGSDKSKLSLGDDPTKTGKYNLVFTLRNTTGKTLSYNLNTYVMTETVSSDGKTVAEQAYMLSPAVAYSVTGGGINGNVVTVSGYSDAVITAVIDLSEADRAYLDASFANGMYVEGFTTLTSRNGDCDLTIPYLGFYGDWTKAPLLDATAFEEGKEAKDPSILDDEKLKADVYATIPMVGFYSGREITYYYMCKPAFILADGYEAPATLEDYCALSTSVNGNFQLKYISAGLLRNAKSVYMTIKDSVTGEVIFEKTQENCRKSYYNGQQTGGYVEVEFDASTAGLANNTKYIFDMTCDLDWEGEQNNLKNNFSFTFYIDDESPAVDFDQTKLRTEKDENGNITRYLLDLYAYDNRFVSGFFLSTYDEVDENGKAIEPENVIDGFIPVDDMVAATTNKITIDLTSIWHKLKDGDEADSKNIEFTLYDYAKNQTVVDMTLSKVDAETVNFKNGRQSTENGDEISFTLRPNKQINLNGTAYLVTTPTDVYTNDLVWESSDTTVANVQNGVVTALKNGTCTITAKSATGATASVTINCTGTAESAAIPVSGLSINTTALVLDCGETYEFYATVSPWNAATQPTLVWSSSSPYVTLIPDASNPYHCTALAAKTGSATISVKAEGTLFSASCRVRVSEEFEYLGSYLKSYTGKGAVQTINGQEEHVVEIPADKGVTRIYRLAFYNNKDITKVIIPEGVEEIEYAAFYGCDNLKEVVLPSTCKVLQEWAFGYDEALEKINLENVKTIFRLAFYNDKALKEIDLTSCCTLGDRAFSFCDSLESVDISNVGQIGEYAFVYCTKLEELVTSSLNKIENYAFTGCSALRSLDLYATYVGEYAFYFCSELSNVTFWSDVTEIDSCAFYNNSSLSNISFKKTCKYINDFAFANCFALTSIRIPAGCEYLGDFAFGAARNAQSISFSADANIRSIGQNPFYLVYQVENFTVDAGSKYLTVGADGMLYDKNMTKLILAPFAKSLNYYFAPDSVTKIGEYAFSTVYRIQTLNFNNVENIGEGAFAMSGLVNVLFGTKLKTIGDYAFNSCSDLKPFTLPEGVTSIGDYAFAAADTAWGNLTFPSSLANIGNYAYANNEGLVTVKVPASVGKIGEGTFSQCENLTGVTIENGITEIGDYAFLSDSALTAISLPDSVETLGEGAFGLCTELKTVTLSSALTSIPAKVFFRAEAIETISIPDSVTEIGELAFYYADKLKTVNFNNVKTIGNYAFTGTALTSASANTVETIGDYAFADTDLTSISFASATDIGRYAFYDAENLTSVSLDAVVNLGDYAFYRASKLESVNLPACESIGNYAFALANALKTVAFPVVKSVGSYAFYNTGLTSFTLPATVEDVKPNAFTTKAYSSTDDTLVRIDTIVLDANNKKFFLDENGALYKYLTDTTYLLVAYPSGKKDVTAYTVKDGTVRIADYAFCTNTYLTDITVARTVKYIGDGAFYGCTALSKLNFLSVVAPTLESKQSYASVDGWTYNNFIYEIGGENEVNAEVIVPSNAVAYDSMLWTKYIGTTTSSGVLSMTDSTAYLISSINSLPETVTLENADTVDYLEKVYNATDSSQKSFVTNISKLNLAIETIKTLRSQNQNPDKPDDTTPTDDDNNGKLPTYAIVLIAVGSVLALCAVAFVIKHFSNKNKKGGKNDAE